MNMILLERACCILFQAGLDRSFWIEAYNHAYFSELLSINYKLNILFEVLYGTPVNSFNLKVFSYPSYTHINNSKFEPRALMFLEYPFRMNGYR